jgi:hypothetical protein
VNESGYHWIAFYLDLTVSPVTCTLFDPQQVDTSYKKLEEAVRAVIAPQLPGSLASSSSDGSIVRRRMDICVAYGAWFFWNQ